MQKSKKIIVFLFSFFLFLSSFLPAKIVMAGWFDRQLGIGDESKVIGTTFSDDVNNVKTPQQVAIEFIKVFLSFMATIFLAMLVWGGYLWMTAGGDESQTTKAKQVIGRSVLGMVIILFSYAITYYVGVCAVDIAIRGEDAWFCLDR